MKPIFQFIAICLLLVFMVAWICDITLTNSVAINLDERPEAQKKQEGGVDVGKIIGYILLGIIFIASLTFDIISHQRNKRPRYL